jgi:hypothetical protein
MIADFARTLMECHMSLVLSSEPWLVLPFWLVDFSASKNSERQRIRVQPAIVRVMPEWLSLDDDHFVHMVLGYVGNSNVDRKLPSGLDIRFPLGTKTTAQPGSGK